MVKNTHGGSGHKKFARKHTSSKNNNKLRTIEEEGEMYAIVTSLCGNNMFICHCIDNQSRLGRIRGKFSGGRGKRDNMLVVGGWVLVGLREWDVSDTNTNVNNINTKNQKMQECDLLEVYSESDKNQLIDSESENWSILISNDKSRSLTNNGYDDAETSIYFATDKDIERNELIEKMNSETEKKISLNNTTNNSLQNYEEEINIDDI